jgi:hypothetical protein
MPDHLVWHYHFNFYENWAMLFDGYDLNELSSLVPVRIGLNARDLDSLVLAESIGRFLWQDRLKLIDLPPGPIYNVRLSLIRSRLQLPILVLDIETYTRFLKREKFLSP